MTAPSNVVTPAAPMTGASTLAEAATEGTRIERLRYGATDRAPMVSIIIPTLDGQRRGLLQELLADLHEQTLPAFEVVMIIGDRRQGRAINRGAAAAEAKIVVTMDDDTVVGTPSLLQNLVRVLDTHPDVGMVGASTVVPPGCGWFQRVASHQIPRRLFPIVEEVTDSDMVQHPCLAMRKKDFLAIGGEDEELKRGLDPLLRYKVRQHGLRVVIAPHTYISHPLPDSFLAVLRMYYRNGKGSAYAQRHYPERVYELTDGHCRNQFAPKMSFPKRILRYPFRTLGALCRGHFIRVATDTAYALGYLSAWRRSE